MQPWSYWLLAIRPRTLFAGISPVLLGTALAAPTGIRWDVAALAMLSCLCMQMATNLINDCYDSLHGVDTAGRLGPVRVTQQKYLTVEDVRRGYRLLLLAAAICGLPLVIRGGLPILLVGLAALVGAWLYTGGPWPLAYHGLGEALAFVFFGLAATCGTYYLHTLQLNWQVWLWAAASGFLAALIMAVNNLRDLDTDRQTGKTTLAVLLGPLQARIFTFGLVMLPLLIPPFFVLLTGAHHAVLLVTLAPLLFYKSWHYLLCGPIDRHFNAILANCGKYMFVYVLWVSLVFVFGG